MSSGIDELKAHIRAIECRRDGASIRRPAAAAVAGPAAGGMSRAEAPAAAAWTLGAWPGEGGAGFDGLETGGLHEIKPALRGGDWPAAWAAARGFALALAVRCAMARDDPDTAGGRRGGMVMWCTSAVVAAEFGAPYGGGFAAFGLDPGRVLMVEPARSQDVLWALEQGLKSGSLALVVGQFDDVGLTPARRLALAAAHTDTPCVLLTHPRAPPTGATATRWRVGPARSGRHRLDPEASGAARFAVTLERCRSRPPAADQDTPFILEWCDAAYRFHLAPDVADRADAASRSSRGAAR